MLGHVSGRFRGRRFCHLRQTYFVTRASWRDAWRDAAGLDLASHLKAPPTGRPFTHLLSPVCRGGAAIWAAPQPSSASRQLRSRAVAIRRPAPPPARRRRRQRPSTRSDRASPHRFAKGARTRCCGVADRGRAAVRHGLVAVTAPGIARAASLWWSGRFVCHTSQTWCFSIPFVLEVY